MTYSWHKCEECEIVLEPSAKILLLSDLNSEILIVSVDLCSMEYGAVAKIRDGVFIGCGISPSAFFIAATHAHSSIRVTHGFDSAGFSGKISEHVKALRKRLEKVEEIEEFEGLLPEGSLINRRFKFPNKDFGAYTATFNTDCEIGEKTLDVKRQILKYLDSLGIDPGMTGLGERAELDGPSDRRIHLAVLKGGSGTIAAFCRVNAHPVIVSQSRVGKKISPDYPGFMREIVEKRIGTELLVFNGAFGDVRPLNREYSFKEAERIGTLMAESFFSGKRKLVKTPSASLKICVGQLKTSSDTPRSLEGLDSLLRDLKKRMDNEKSPGLKKVISEEIRKIDNLVESFKQGISPVAPEDFEKGSYPFEASSLRIGEFRMLGIAGEPCVEFAREVERRTAHLPVGVAAGSIGYIVYDEKEYEMGGYEASETYYSYPDGIKTIFSTIADCALRGCR